MADISQAASAQMGDMRIIRRSRRADRFATVALAAIAGLVMLIVVSMVAYILYEGLFDLVHSWVPHAAQPLQRRCRWCGVPALRFVLSVAHHADHLRSP